MSTHLRAQLRSNMSSGMCDTAGLSHIRPGPGQHLQTSVDLMCAAMKPRGSQPLATMLVRMLTQRDVLPCLQADRSPCRLTSELYKYTEPNGV
jgi:hypothetical protein